MILNRKTANVNVKTEFIYKCYRLTSKTAKIGTENLVAEHVGVVMICTTTEFTVTSFAVLDVSVYNTCIQTLFFTIIVVMNAKNLRAYKLVTCFMSVDSFLGCDW